MKYWRGYVVAIVLAACAWGLTEFAQSHWVLVDMVYPYTARLIQNFMANWSSGAAYCLWQLFILILAAGAIASIVLMIVLKWSPIQWFGWVMSVVSLVALLNTGLYGLNKYAGPLADDIRLEVTEYTVTDLQNAAAFYQEKANELATQVKRDSSGQVDFDDFDTLAQQATDGFDALTYEEYLSVFAGERIPVKKLGWSSFFTGKGKTFVHVAITGEAAVNPETPDLGLPFAMCQAMSNRISIANQQDAAFAAFLACTHNESKQFQYSGYFMAYRYCYNALNDLNVASAQAVAQRLQRTESRQLHQDMENYNASFAAQSDYAYYTPEEKADTRDSTNVTVADTPLRSHVADLLVSWHIQQYVLPELEQEEVTFDPMDETQVDLSGIKNAQ